MIPGNPYMTGNRGRVPEPAAVITKSALRDDEVIIRWALATRRGQYHLLEVLDMEDNNVNRVALPLDSTQLRELQTAIAEHLLLKENDHA